MKNILKRAISVLLVVVMVFGSSPFAGFVGLGLPELNLFSTEAEAADGDGIVTIPEDCLRYTIDDNGNVTIDWGGYDGNGGTVKIPSTIEDKPVTTIASGAFSWGIICDTLIIPDSVKTIESNAFEGLEVSVINLGEGVETIGENAFSNIYTPFSVYVGRNLKSIGVEAFGYEGCLPETIYYLGTQEEWDAIEIADCNEGINDRVVYLGKPVVKSNVKSYDSLNTEYDNFIYLGSEVYEIETVDGTLSTAVTDATLTDYYVDAGQLLEERLYIKGDFYFGNSQFVKAYDNSFFDVTQITTSAVNSSGYSTAYTGVVNPENPVVIKNDLQNTVTSADCVTEGWIKIRSGYTADELAVIDYVQSTIRHSGYASDKAYVFDDDVWLVSWVYKVKDGLADGTTGYSKTLSGFWNCDDATAESKTSQWVQRKGNINIAAKPADSTPAEDDLVYITDAKTSFVNYDLIEHFLFDDLEHNFTIGANPNAGGAVTNKCTVTFLENDGTEISKTEYFLGAAVAVPAAVNGQIGWANTATGALVDLTGYRTTKNIELKRVLGTDVFDIVINVDGGTVDADALPDNASVNGDGNIVIRANFNAVVTLADIPMPTKEGYTGAWAAETVTVDNINGKATKVVWTANTYKATFYANMGDAEPLAVVDAAYGTFVQQNITAPEGYKFAGWADAETGELVSTAIRFAYKFASDKTFCAVWAEYDSSITVMVRDYANGSGWKVGAITYGDYGIRLSRLDVNDLIDEAAASVGANAGYVNGMTSRPYLLQNETDTTPVTVTTGITFNGHATYYLLTTFDFSVIWKVPVFDAETGKMTGEYTETASSASTALNGETDLYSADVLTNADVTPSERYVFSGWIDEATGEQVAYDEAVGVTLNASSGSERTFVAQYVSSGKYTIDWIVDGEVISSAFCSAGDSIAAPESPVKEGYTFVGWTPEVPATMPEQDLEFVAVFTPDRHTVTWVVDGAETVVEYNYGDEIVAPETPVKTGYTFIGWGADVPSTMPNEDLIFTAQWEICKYTVTWIVDGEETVFEYSYGEEIAVPETPVKEGYTFEGWTPEVPATMPEQDLEFVAVFTLDRHTVTWVVDGAETVVEYGYGEYIYYPQTPYKAGYTFVGWTPEVPAKMPDEDLTFTAQWRINKHSVTWVVDGAETVFAYSYGDEIYVPESPAKKGYIFAGWTPEVPATMPDYDLYFTATWIQEATDNTCGENLTWSFNESTGELVISGTGEMAEWWISSSAPWYDLSGLIKKVTIEDGVTNIDGNAFSDCTNLASVTIPGSIKNIGNYAFAHCTSIINIVVDENNQYYSSDENGVLFNKDKTELLKYTTGSTRTSYVIPDSVTSIGWWAFYNCTSLVSIEIPDRVTTIGDDVFEGCTSLASVTISDSVTSIGYRAFFGCTSLTSVTIPAGVTSIGHNAFEDCTSLASVTIPDSVTGISTYAFVDTAVYNNSENWENDVFYIGNHLISAKDTLSGNYKVKDGTKTIGIYAFRNCINLEGIVIPDSVFYLGAYAFEGCEKLKDVTLSHNITAINTCTFYFCSSLTDIEIPEGVTEIGLDAFLACQNLKSVTLPLSLREIEFESFSACPKLTSVYYPGTPEQWMMTVNDMSTYTYDLSNTIVYECNSARPYYSCINYDHIDWTLDPATGELVINGWGDMYYTPWNVHSSLVKSVTISEGITSIYDSAFYGFTGLTSVIIPDSVTTIGNNAFGGCTSLESVIIPDSVTSIANNAFEDTAVYNNGANWENGVLYIGNHLIKAEESLSGDYQIRTGTRTIAANAFRGCAELTGVTIPNSVVSIGDYAFSGCSGLTSVVIPNGVKGIGNGAFSGCTNIADIILPDSIESIGYEVFNSTAYYKDSTNWENGVLYINNCLVGGDGTPAGTYPIREGTVVIGGMVFMGCESLTGVVIPDSVKGISGGAFLLSGLTSVTIPDSVTSIGESAFAGCEKLTSITIPDSVTSIGMGAFQVCTSLVNITIPDSVTSIGESAFAGCSSLTSLVIPDSVTSPIREDDFDDCTALATLIIGDGVPGIEDRAFEDCGKFETIVIGNGVRIVGSRLFPEYNFRVETFVVGSSVQKIGYENFGFLNIKNLIILNGIKRLEKFRFGYCYGNEYIHIPSSVVSIEEGNIWSDSDRAKNVEIAIEEIEKMSESSLEELAEYGLTIDDVKNWPKKTVICSDTEDCYAKTFAEQNGNEFRVCSGHDIPDIPEIPEEPETPENPELITGTCGDNLTWTLDTVTGELVISGTGDMWDWTSSSDAPWYNHCSSIKTVTLPDGLTSIGDYSFAYCESLASVEIPDGVTRIGYGAFRYCINLTSITLPEGLTSIGETAFGSCIRLTDLTIPNSVTSIGDAAFLYCWSMRFIHIPSNVTSIGFGIVAPDSAKANFIDWVENMTDEEFAEEAGTSGLTREDVASWPTTTLICSDSEDAYAKTYAEQNGNEFKVCGGDHRKEFTVTLNIDGVQSVVTLKEGDAISIESPVKEGHTFVGWTPEMPETMPAENLEFTAVFEANSYKVTWIIDGMAISETHKFGAPMDKSKSFEKHGYTFIGWTPEVPETMPAYDLEFTAVFEINICDAVFNANGGLFTDGDSVKRIPTVHNAEIVAPQDPERAGYKFSGWAYNGKNIGTEVGVMDSTEGKIFDAVWIPDNKTSYRVETYTMNTLGEYDVSYMLVNAVADEEVSVNPTATEGFEINEEKSVLSGTVSLEETLVLKVYIDRKQYKLTTVVDDTETSVLYYYGSIVADPEWPSKDGYYFRYWSPSVPVIMPANDVTVTAIFGEDRIPRIVMSTPEKRTIYYGESITLYVTTYDLPYGAKIKWEVVGDGVSIKTSASGKTCTVTSTSNGNVVIKAYVVDSRGNTIEGNDLKPVCDSEYLYSKVTWWLKIVNFFKQLFGKTGAASQIFKVR